MLSDAAPPGLRVLVVDDDRDTADALELLLQQCGFRTAHAYDGTTAFAIAENLRPDVLLLDLSMPGLGGLDLCRLVRSETWGTRMRIVAVSGWTRESDKQAAQEVGCNAYLIKPASLADLVRAIKGT